MASAHVFESLPTHAAFLVGYLLEGFDELVTLGSGQEPEVWDGSTANGDPLELWGSVGCTLALACILASHGWVDSPEQMSGHNQMAQTTTGCL